MMTSGKIRAIMALATIVAVLLVPALPRAVVAGAATAEATRSIDPQTVGPGGMVEVTVEFQSLLDYVEAFALVEDIPPGWGFAPVDDDASFITDDGAVSWVWVEVAAGASKTVVYTLTAPFDAAAGEHPVQGVVKAAGEHNPVFGDHTVTVDAEAPSDVTAQASRIIAPATIGRGETVEVTVQFESRLDRAELFALVEDIPAGWEFKSIDDGDATEMRKDAPIVWLWDEVAAGATRTVVYTLTAPDDAAAGEHPVQGVVKAAGEDNPILGDDTVTVDAEAPSDVTAQASRIIAPATIGRGETVEVTVQFESRLDRAELFALVEDIPAGWEFKSIDDGDATEMRKDAPIVWLWDEVAAGATRTVVYTLTAPDDAAAAVYALEGAVNAAGEDSLVRGHDTITVEVEEAARYNVTLVADPPGTGELEGGGRYEAGETVTIEIVDAADNYNFVNWTSVPAVAFADAAAQETTFTMPAQDVTVTARFEAEEDTYAVTLVADPPEGGEVTPGTGAYYPGDTVEITATENPGYRFVEWTTTPTALREELADPTARETGFEMRASDVTVTARFEREEGTYMVTVLADPPEGGEVSPSSAAYYPGEMVDLTATENPGYRFVEWTTTPTALREELADPTARETGFEMRASDVTVTAHFEPETVPPVDDDDDPVNTLAVLLALAAGASLLAAAGMFFSRRKLRQSEEGPGPGEPGDHTSA